MEAKPDKGLASCLPDESIPAQKEKKVGRLRASKVQPKEQEAEKKFDSTPMDVPSLNVPDTKGGKKQEEIDKKKKNKKPKRDVMQEGELCKSNQFTWKIINILGSGGFGDVYRVIKENDPDQKEYAMKTEMVIGNKRMLRLKIEVEALINCNQWKNRKHFVDVIDRGKTEKFKFIVMTLVGASLEDYRKKYDVEFTTSTALQIGIQTIEALRDFHHVGWIHRDIKPANFAYGLGENITTIYLLDFGIAKKIYAKDGKNVKTPRCKVKFLGTMRFASRTCHYCLEQGRKDDLETWIYFLFDIVDRKKGLPWKKDGNKNIVINKKEKFCKDTRWFDEQYNEMSLMKDFHLILEHLAELSYYEEPRYDLIKIHLQQTAKKRNIDLTLPLDWTIPRPELNEEKKPEKTGNTRENSGKQEGSLDADEDTNLKTKKRKKNSAEQKPK